MHDCYPKNFASSIPNMKEAQKTKGYNGFWNGDVFKTIIWLRSQRKDLNVSVLNCDHGLGVIYKGQPESHLSYTPKEIDNMDYDFFSENVQSLLNLQEPIPSFRKFDIYE